MIAGFFLNALRAFVRLGYAGAAGILFGVVVSLCEVSDVGPEDTHQSRSGGNLISSLVRREFKKDIAWRLRLSNNEVVGWNLGIHS
jgi:hypothetical protein